MENTAYWFAFRLTFSCHSYETQAHLPTVGWVLLSISNQEKAPQTGLRADLVEVAPQLRVPLPRCIKLTTKICHQIR